MKRIHYLIISLLIAVPMWAQQTSEAVIRGTVQGFTRPLLVCNIVKEGRTPDTLKIENGKFVQSVTDWTERQEAFFQIQDENFYKQILIKLLPGKSLTLDIKKDKDDLQIVYGGELGPITEYTNLERDIYTLSKTFAPESWNQLKDFQECKSYVDTKLNQLLDALQQLDDTDFISQKRVHIESGKPQQYLSFGLHKQQTGTDMKQDAAYMDFIRNLDVNDPQNEGLLFTYLEWYHAAHPDFLSESALPDPAKKIRLVKEVIQHPELRNHMAGNYLNVTLFTQMLGAKIDDILPDVYQAFLDVSTDEERCKMVRSQMTILKNKTVGAPAVSIELEDVNGKRHTLDEVIGKGKYTYIDFWATWCVPCLKEIPALKELAEANKNRKDFRFISISIDTKKDTWRKKVQKDNLPWEQYVITVETACADAYGITSIPRFMMFDKNGYMLNNDAPRPSEAALKELLNTLK